MVAFVRTIGKAWFFKTGVARKAADPVAMQEGIEMFCGMTYPQMLQIGVPYPVVGRLFQFEVGEDHLAAGLERAKGIGGIKI